MDLNLRQLKEEIEFELDLTPEELETTSTTDLKDYLKKLKRNSRRSDALMVKHKNARSIPGHIEYHRVNIEEQIDNIKEVLEAREDVSKNAGNKKTKSNLTINQKYQIIKKMGVIELMVDKFDSQLQHEIFSELFDCHLDTSRKILSGTYKNTKEVRSIDYKELLTKIKQ